MGGTFAKNMTDMQENMLKRQIELNACQVRERQMAMQIARQREMTNWMLAFYAIAAPAMIAKGKTNPTLLAPLLPITFVVGYNTDMAYGNKMHRIRMDAENILEVSALHDKYLLLPTGEPTLEAIDENLRRKGRIPSEVEN